MIKLFFKILVSSLEGSPFKMTTLFDNIFKFLRVLIFQSHILVALCSCEAFFYLILIH